MCGSVSMHYRTFLFFFISFHSFVDSTVDECSCAFAHGVDFIPASIYLSAVDAKLRTEMGAERMLAEVLEPLRSQYDYILLDTCPSLGVLTINALAAADEVIIATNPQLLEEFRKNNSIKN